MDINQMYTDMEETIDRLRDEDLGAGRGSREYKEAKEACENLAGLWDSLKDRTSGELSDTEIERARRYMENATDKIQTYLDKKQEEAERAEENGKELSETATHRVDAMKSAMDRMNKQMEALDEMAAGRDLESPLPSWSEMTSQNSELYREMEKADEHVFNGSSMYDNAREDLHNVNLLFLETMGNKKDGELPTAGEIETLRASIEKARDSADKYIEKREDRELTNATTRNRVNTAGRMKDNLDMQNKLLDSWEKQLAEKEPEKSYSDLAKNSNELSKQIEDSNAKPGVVTVSDEFKKVNDLLKKQEEKWKDIEKKGPDYKMTSKEAHDLEVLNRQMDNAVNQYIRKKAGKELSATGKERLQLMQKVKNHALSQQKKLDARVGELIKESVSVTNEELAKGSRETAKTLRDADRNVHFGSRAFRNAMQSYNRSYQKWQEFTEREAKGEVTAEERAAQRKELREAKKNIDKYLDSKKNKNLDKNPKTKKRVEAMEKARKNIEIRLYKMQAADKKFEERDRDALKERKQTLRQNLKSEKTLERQMARASLAADEKLQKLSERRDFSKQDIKNARMSLAAKVLEERLKVPGQEKLKNAIAKSGKAYAEAVQAIANSKEFKETFPDSKLTPANCKNYLTNQKAVQKASKEFNDKLIKKAQANKQMQNQKQKQAQKAPAENNRKIG